MPIVTPEAELVVALSSRTPVAAGASFTSPWIRIDRMSDIRIGVLTDRDGDLRTQHSNDNGASIIRDSSQLFVANVGEFLSFHPRGDFFRVKLTNTSAVSQTTLDLATHISSISYGITQSKFSAPLGRTSLGIQARSLVYDFDFDETARVSPQINDLYTVQRTSLIADNFRQSGGLDLVTWNRVVTGTGTAIITSGRLQFQTGVTANSTAQVTSFQRGRFMSGSHQIFRVGAKIPDAGVVNCKRRFGVFDNNNGYFYELDGTILYAVSRRSGVDTRVASSSWNVITTFVLSAAGSSHRFELNYFGNTCIFVINGDVHHIMSGEVGGLPRTAEINFPNRFELINFGGNIVDNALTITGTSQQRYGPDQASPRFINLVGAQSILIKADAGALRRVIVNSGSGTNTAVFYDNTAASGTTIATIDVNKNQGSIEFGTNFSNGLFVVTTGAGTDVTVIFD